MSLENNIKDVISQAMNDGTVEKLVKEKLAKGIADALEDLFKWGDLKDIIKKQIKSVMIPYLENYDYSEYIMKLDSVLVDVLKNSTLENKKLLGNFKELMSTEEMPKSIKLTKLFEKWMEYVAKEVDTKDLEVVYDDGVSYEPVKVSFQVEKESDRDWSSFENATLVFECEKDEEMNFMMRLSRWKKDKDEEYSIHYDAVRDINSLRYLNEFQIFLMKMEQYGTKIEIDDDYGSDEVTPEKEPEPTYQ